LSRDVFDVLITIVHHSGWACRHCRSERKDCLGRLQSALSRVNEELADVRSSLAAVVKEMNSFKSSAAIQSSSSSSTDIRDTNHANACLPQPTPLSDNGMVKSQKSAVSEVQLEIQRALHDVTKRKCNVVVTGLPEPACDTEDENKSADQEAFSRLCEEHLPLKPIVARKGCIRLGRINEQKPRRLLVHLTSESSTTNLLTVAKQLRNSDNDYVAANVYINPDMSPAEAKLAFEQRERRRSLRRTASSRDAAGTEQVNSSAVTVGASQNIKQIVDNQCSGITADVELANDKQSFQ
jgi:hypothetical protein